MSDVLEQFRLPYLLQRFGTNPNELAKRFNERYPEENPLCPATIRKAAQNGNTTIFTLEKISRVIVSDTEADPLPLREFFTGGDTPEKLTDITTDQIIDIICKMNEQDYAFFLDRLRNERRNANERRRYHQKQENK